MPAPGSSMSGCCSVAALLGSAAIHAAVIPEHLAEWPAAGGFFVLLAAAEIAVAAA